MAERKCEVRTQTQLLLAGQVIQNKCLHWQEARARTIAEPLAQTVDETLSP
jgi:hypothetical protein